MSEQITIDIPHQLGRAVARERLDKGMGQVASSIPGASLIEHHWEGDTLSFVLQVMGQRVGAKMLVLDATIHATIDLPPLAALLANTVKSRFLSVGTKLLR